MLKCKLCSFRGEGFRGFFRGMAASYPEENQSNQLIKQTTHSVNGLLQKLQLKHLLRFELRCQEMVKYGI